MDPKANLKRQRELADEIIHLTTVPPGDSLHDDDVATYLEEKSNELAELVVAYTDWIQKGGFAS